MVKSYDNHYKKPFFPGMACFAWNNANENNSNIGRRNFEAAGALGVMTIATGVVYLLDFFWVVYQKAIFVEEDGYRY